MLQTSALHDGLPLKLLNDYYAHCIELKTSLHCAKTTLRSSDLQAFNMLQTSALHDGLPLKLLNDYYARGAPTTALASIKVRMERSLAFSVICSVGVGKDIFMTTVPA